MYLSKKTCSTLLKLDVANVGLAVPEDSDMIDPVTFGLNRAPFTLSDGYNYDIHAIVGMVRRTSQPSTKIKSPIVQDHELVACGFPNISLMHRVEEQVHGPATLIRPGSRDTPGTRSHHRCSDGRRSNQHRTLVHICRIDICAEDSRFTFQPCCKNPPHPSKICLCGPKSLQSRCRLSDHQSPSLDVSYSVSLPLLKNSRTLSSRSASFNFLLYLVTCPSRIKYTEGTALHCS